MRSCGVDECSDECDVIFTFKGRGCIFTLVRKYAHISGVDFRHEMTV